MYLQVKDPWKFNTVRAEAGTQQNNQNHHPKPKPFDWKRSVMFPSAPTLRTVEGLALTPSFSMFKNPFRHAQSHAQRFYEVIPSQVPDPRNTNLFLMKRKQEQKNFWRNLVEEDDITSE